MGAFPINPSILHVSHYTLGSHPTWPKALSHSVNIPDHCEMYKLLPCVHTLHVHVMLHVHVHVHVLDYV